MTNLVLSEFHDRLKQNLQLHQKVRHHELIFSLSLKIVEILQALVPARSAVALLDFPNHSNVGDSAVWLGQRLCLRMLGVSVPYMSDLSNFSHAELGLRLREGAILLSGGSNLGDLWPQHQLFREKIIASFPNRKIIQLPQSICFLDKENLKRAQKIFNRHPDLTLLLRDQKSLEIARNEFRAPSLLCPDMAFAMGPLTRFSERQRGGVWLRRRDREAVGNQMPWQEADMIESDWKDEDATWALSMNRFLNNRMRSHSHSIRKDFPLICRTYDRMAQDRVVRGSQMLSSHEVVVTDRLHGHIFSLLLGIPNIVLDNRTGKNKSFYETWTRPCEISHWADSPEDAMTQAESLIHNPPVESELPCSA